MRACAEKLHGPAGPRAEAATSAVSSLLSKAMAKVLVDRRLAERFVLDLEMAVRERDVVERLVEPGQRLDQADAPGDRD